MKVLKKFKQVNNILHISFSSQIIQNIELSRSLKFYLICVCVLYNVLGRIWEVKCGVMNHNET